MDNSETSLSTTVYKASGNTVREIVERFIKTRASTMFGKSVYLMYWPGTLNEISGLHDEFFNSALGIWIGGRHFSNGCCGPIRMHEVWRDLGISQHIVEQLSSMRHEVAMRRAIVVPGKHGMSDLMLALK